MPKLEILIASTLYLMTRQGRSSKAGVEQAIADHLAMLSSHPDCHSKVLKDAGQRLAMSWRQEARIKQLGIDESNSLSKRRKPTSLH